LYLVFTELVMVNSRLLLSSYTAYRASCSCSKSQVLLHGPHQANFSASCKSVWS